MAANQLEREISSEEDDYQKVYAKTAQLGQKGKGKGKCLVHQMTNSSLICQHKLLVNWLKH